MKSAPAIRAPIMAVALASAVTLGAIIYSHYAQERDKRVMRAGVERDKERLRIKKMLQQQEQQSQ